MLTYFVKKTSKKSVRGEGGGVNIASKLDLQFHSLYKPAWGWETGRCPDKNDLHPQTDFSPTS